MPAVRPLPPPPRAPSAAPSSPAAGPASQAPARPEAVKPPAPPAEPAEAPSDDPDATRKRAPANPGASKTQLGIGGAEAPADPRVTAARADVDSMLEELALVTDRLRTARLCYEIGRLMESPLGEADGAAEHYLKAHGLRPEHVPTIRGARRVLLGARRFQEALPLYDAEARVTADPSAKALVLFEKGRALEDLMALRDEARRAYEAALDLDGTNLTILQAVARCEHLAQAWPALDKTYEAAANAASADSSYRAALVTERARLAETKRKDPRTATELHQTALSLDSDAPGSLEALKRLHYAHGQWRDLAEALRLEAAKAMDSAGRAMAHYRLARVLADRLGVLDEAVAAMERAHAEAPEDTMILEELTRFYELGKRWDPLVGALERLVARDGSPRHKVPLMHRIGQIVEERLKDEERAIDWYTRTLSVDPVFAPALAALGKLLTRRKDWAPLVAMHNAEAEGARDSLQRAAAHARIAEIYDAQLGNTGEAMRHHGNALVLAPGYAPSFKALERLYTQGQMHRALVDLYEHRLEHAATDEKITLLFKIGRVQEDALGEPGLAVRTFQRILEIEPAHSGALHAVQRTAERAGRHKDLVAALEREIAVSRDPAVRVALLHRAGEVSEAYLDDDDAALGHYRAALDVSSSYAPALSSLGRLHYRRGRWEDLLGIYRLELANLPKGPDAAALLFKMGELAEERLGRDDEAIEHYRRAIDSDAFHRPALHALARKLTEKERWDDLVRLLGLELSGLTDPADRARTCFRMAEVYENRLAAPEKALESLQGALTAVPTFRPALDGRARLLAHAGEWKALVEHLAREAQAASDPAQAVRALFRQGAIHRDHLDEPRRAVECFDAILARDPRHLGAILALERLYGAMAAWEPLSKLHAISARIITDGGGRAAALREVARLQETKGLGDATAQRDTQRAILEANPGDALALAALERLALEQRDMGLLLEVDAALASSSGDPATAAAHFTRLGESQESFGMNPAALESYRAALARDPENLAAARGLARVAERFGDPDLLGEASAAQARVTRDLESAARLLVASAAIRSERQADPDGAATDLERALVLNPDHEEAARRLRAVLLARGETDRLHSALGNAARSARHPERRAALAVAQADLLADGGNVPTAISVLQRATDLDGSAPETLMKLAELYANERHWSEAVDRLTQVLTLSPPREAYLETHLRLAAILDERLGDGARALASVRAVLEVDPKHRAALKRLLGLQLRNGTTAEASKTAARLVEVSVAPPERADALLHLARLAREARNSEEAVRAYLGAIELTGLGGGAAKELRDLLVEQKLLGDDPRWGEYVTALDTHARNVELDAAAAAALHREMARVQFDELHAFDRALATLQRAVSLAPGDATLRFELASRLRLAQHLPEAADELRRVIDLDATNVEAWRELCDVFKALGREDQARAAMSAILAVGAANDLELATLSANPPRPASGTAGSFNETTFLLVDPGAKADAPAAQLLGALCHALHKIHPPELERYGLSARDKLTSRSGHPVRSVVDDVARMFGVEEVDVYVHRAHAGALEIELTSPPSLLVPAHATELTESKLVFLVARRLANVARGVYAVDRLSAEELELLLAAAARLVDPSFGAGLAEEDFLNGHGRRIGKAIAWLSKGNVEDAAQQYVQAARIDVPLWTARVRQAAARAALVVSDDVAGSVETVRRLEADLAGVTGHALAQGMALVSDLLRFGVSDAAFGLRRRLGMT